MDAKMDYVLLTLIYLLAAGVLVAAGLVVRKVRRANVLHWLGPYLRDHDRRSEPGADETIDVLICIADHYEPKADGADFERGLTRVRHWCREYPRLFGRFRDSSGRPPRHSFFFPAEEYEPEYLDLLADLCRDGYGEVEVHLHHHDDTADNLRRTLEEFKRTLVERHGLLGRDRQTGETRYAFIHGNWSLCNSRPDGTQCGVDQELTVLRETGCCVDMTYPSAPSPTQPAIVNRIYYARDLPGRRASHEVGTPIGERLKRDDEMLLIQGPLVFDWRRPKWGVAPRLENGCLQETQPPSLERLANWLRARVQVPGRPDWYFVKLHAHGAPEDAHGALLDEPMVRFHEGLAERARENPRFRYHYVSAREMYNLAKAAEAGFRGSVAEGRDFLLTSNLSEEPALVGRLS
jgi:hypothetical protein